MKKTLITISLPVLISISCPGNSRGENSRSFSASFLQIQPSARQTALGDNQAAASGHLESQFSNPALLGTLSVPEVFVSHNSSFFDNNYETLGVGLPAKNQALSAALQYSQSPSVQRTKLDGSGNIEAGLGHFKPSVSIVRLGWALRPINRFSLGINAKTWKEELDKKSYDGVAADVGLFMSSVLKGLDIGVSAQNLGEKQKGYDLPRKLDLGLAYQPQQAHLRYLKLLTNYSALETSRSVNLGLEADNNTLFSLRAGYKLTLNENVDNLNGISLGAAFRYRGWQLDYAWKTTEDLNDLHLFSLTIALGLTPDEKRAASEKMDREISTRIQEKSDHHLNLAEKAAHEKEWDRALQELNASLTWNPLNAEAKVLLGNVSYQKNKSDSIKQYYRGLEAVRQKEWIDALLYFQESIKLHPDDNPARNELARINSQRSVKQIQDMKSDALNQQIFDRGVFHYINGDFVGALNEWGKISKSTSAFPELKEYMAKAKTNILEAKLSTYPDSSKNKNQQIENLSRNAYTYYTLGNFKEAASTWEKVLLLDPTHEEASWAIKQMDGKKALEKTSETADRKVQELNSQAFLEYSSGRLENSIRLWKKALVLNPRDVRIKNNIERVESEIGIKANLP